MKEYALYKGENLIIIGTVSEIARAHNVKEDTIRYYGTKAYFRKRKNSPNGNYYILISIDEDIEEYNNL